MKKTWQYRLSSYVIAAYLLKILALLALKPLYWFDEIAIFLISRNPIPQIFETILTERFHPPGFYLFLKLLPIDQLLFSKIIITTIGYALVYVALRYGEITGLIKRHNLKIGLLIFLSSYVFLQISSDVKQDALAFPLLLIIFFKLLKLFDNKSKISKHQTIFLNLLLILIFSLAYVNYLIALMGVAIIFYVYRKKIIRNTLVFQGLLMFCYFPYAVLQYAHAYERDIWTTWHHNSFMRWLPESLIGAKSPSLLGDISLFVFMAFMFIALSKITIKIRKSLVDYYLLVFIFMVPILYFQKTFIVPRYNIFLFFLLSILAGRGLRVVEMKSKITNLSALAISLFLLFSSSMYVAEKTNVKVITKNIVSIIEGKAEEMGRVGFTSNFHSDHLAYKLWYMKDNDNVVPVNAFVPNLVNSKETFDKEVQINEKSVRTTNVKEIATRLLKNNLKNYIYFSTQAEVTSPYWRDNEIKRALLSICTLKEIMPIQNDRKSELHIFSDCGPSRD